MIDENFSPSPVSVTTPTISPAPAQVVPTLSMPTEPPSSARTSFEPIRPRHRPCGARNRSRGSSAQSARRKLVSTASTVAQNTDSTGEKPSSMNAMIDTSDTK